MGYNKCLYTLYYYQNSGEIMLNKNRVTVLLFVGLIGSGFCADATFDKLTVSDRAAIGSGASLNTNRTLLVYRPSSDVGADKATIYGFRAGAYGATGGSDFSNGVDAAIVGYNYWGNPFSAAISGIGYLDYKNSTILSAYEITSGVEAKLCYRDLNDNKWSGYFNGSIYGTNDLVLGTDQNNSRWIINSTSHLSQPGQILSIAPDRDGQYYSTGDNRFISIDRTEGNLGIGVNPTNGKGRLQVAGSARVNGTVYCKELRVTTNVWADYVFEDDYKLKSLKEVERFIAENKHLPGIPSEKEVLENGVNVVEMQTKMLKTMEELTLHLIELKKENEILAKKVSQLTENVDKE